MSADTQTKTPHKTLKGALMDAAADLGYASDIIDIGLAYARQVFNDESPVPTHPSVRGMAGALDRVRVAHGRALDALAKARAPSPAVSSGGGDDGKTESFPQDAPPSVLLAERLEEASRDLSARGIVFRPGEPDGLADLLSKAAHALGGAGSDSPEPLTRAEAQAVLAKAGGRIDYSRNLYESGREKLVEIARAPVVSPSEGVEADDCVSETFSSAVCSRGTKGCEIEHADAGSVGEEKGSEQRTYPYEEGDWKVLGPEIFASRDGRVISWKGENYVPQSVGDREQIPDGWDGEVCKGCGRHNVVGFHVPDAVWQAVTGQEEGVWCLTCFDVAAAEQQVDWTVDLELFPVSTEMCRRLEHRDTVAALGSAVSVGDELQGADKPGVCSSSGDERPEGLRLHLGRQRSNRFATGWTDWSEVPAHLVEARREQGWEVVEVMPVAEHEEHRWRLVDAGHDDLSDAHRELVAEREKVERLEKAVDLSGTRWSGSRPRDAVLALQDRLGSALERSNREGNARKRAWAAMRDSSAALRELATSPVVSRERSLQAAVLDAATRLDDTISADAAALDVGEPQALKEPCWQCRGTEAHEDWCAEHPARQREAAQEALKALRECGISFSGEGEWEAPIGDDGETYETCLQALRATFECVKREESGVPQAEVDMQIGPHRIRSQADQPIEHNGIPDGYWREVPCGHPPDPVALYTADGHAVCHCGCGLDVEDGHKIEGAPGLVQQCGKCGCHVAVPPRPVSWVPQGGERRRPTMAAERVRIYGDAEAEVYIDFVPAAFDDGLGYLRINDGEALEEWPVGPKQRREIVEAFRDSAGVPLPDRPDTISAEELVEKLRSLRFAIFPGDDSDPDLGCIQAECELLWDWLPDDPTTRVQVGGVPLRVELPDTEVPTVLLDALGEAYGINPPAVWTNQDKARYRKARNWLVQLRQAAISLRVEPSHEARREAERLVEYIGKVEPTPPVVAVAAVFDMLSAAAGQETAPIGTREALAFATERCPDCGGDGYHQDDSHPGNEAVDCDRCGGTGRIPKRVGGAPSPDRPSLDEQSDDETSEGVAGASGAASDQAHGSPPVAPSEDGRVVWGKVAFSRTGVLRIPGPDGTNVGCWLPEDVRRAVAAVWSGEPSPAVGLTVEVRRVLEDAEKALRHLDMVPVSRPDVRQLHIDAARRGLRTALAAVSEGSGTSGGDTAWRKQWTDDWLDKLELAVLGVVEGEIDYQGGLSSEEALAKAVVKAIRPFLAAVSGGPEPAAADEKMHRSGERI
jgi:hypothetical protein